MKKSYTSKVVSLALWLLLLPAFGFAQPNATRVYKLVSRSTGKVLDIDSPFGHHLPSVGSAADYTGSASQQWKFMRSFASGTGVYEIINRSSGKVLTVHDSFSGGAGVYVSQDTRQGVVNGVQTNREQLWQLRRLTSVSPNSYELVVMASGMLLTETPGDYMSQRPAQSSGQIWDLVDVSPNPSSNDDLGVYMIRNVRSRYPLSGSRNAFDYTEVTQAPDEGVAAQEWTFAPASTPGYFVIINRVFQYALEIGGSDLQYLYNQGRQANVWGNWGGPNQQWGLYDVYDYHLLTLAEVRDGRPCIMLNHHTGQCLEMGGGGNYPLQIGRRPNQWPYVGTDNQMWYIQYATANRSASASNNSAGVSATSPEAAVASASAPELSLEVFPNPAYSVVTLALPAGSKPSSVEVFNLQGGKVAAPFQAEQRKLDVQDLAPGVYMVVVKDGVRTYRQKLVKK